MEAGASHSPDAPDPLDREARQTSIEVTVAVGIVIAMQLVLAWLSIRDGWTLFHVRGWIWWVPILPELVLAAVVVHDRRKLMDPGRDGDDAKREDVSRRNQVMALLGFIAFWNAVTVILLILELFTGEVRTGGELMMEATVVLFTLVLNFGLIYWELDGGGPRSRARHPDGYRDFLFSQMTDDGRPLVRKRDRPWHPGLIDYAYLAFVTALAWSAADALPVSRRAKLLMALESSVAALTILLVAARAISLFNLP